MIFVALFDLALVTVPLARGDLRELAHLRLKRWPILAGAFVLQVIALKAPLPHGLAATVNLGTYLLGGLYLLANLDIPGMWLICAGTAANVLAQAANGGVMPASASALARAGLSSSTGAAYVNSTIVTNP